PVSKPRPNAEPRPGVFTFQVDVILGDAKRDFTVETDISWDTFRNRVHSYLENPSVVQLGYKVSGEAGRMTHLNNPEDFSGAMERICQKA
ncbi:hypothetical protein BD779DRAFT_1394534, partial [Infundibulicybe gibba]